MILTYFKNLFLIKYFIKWMKANAIIPYFSIKPLYKTVWIKYNERVKSLLKSDTSAHKKQNKNQNKIFNFLQKFFFRLNSDDNGSKWLWKMYMQTKYVHHHCQVFKTNDKNYIMTKQCGCQMNSWFNYCLCTLNTRTHTQKSQSIIAKDFENEQILNS